MKQRPESVRGWRPAMPLLRRPLTLSRSPARRGSRRRPALALRLRADRRVRLTIICLLGLSLLLGGGWLWFRDSSFVGVQNVAVTGETGPDAGAIRAALSSAARSMTTLDVQTSRLYNAVSAFPVVKAIRVSTQFPHGMRIRVVEQLPVAVVTVDGRGMAVASDGTLLRDLAGTPPLPRIQLPIPPGGPRLTEPAALNALAAARAAPRPLLAKISLISTMAPHGLVAQLRAGPAVYLGDASGLSAKWRAALDVLTNAAAAGASYIDVTDPARPAAGVGGSAGSAGGSAAGAASSPSAAAGTGAPALATAAAGSTALPSQTPATTTGG